MIEKWFSFWRGPALAAALLLLALSACGGGPGLPNESRGGFLPIPTMTPAPVQPTADYLSVELGEAVNVYEEFSLDGVRWIQLYERGTTTWILDPVAVRAVLALLNTEVTLEAWDSPIANQLILIAHWPPGRGPVGPLDVLDSLDFIVDQDAAMIAAGAVVGTSVLFPMPEGFLELLRASASDITPTPTQVSTPEPTHTPRPTRTPTISPGNVVFFGHPEGELLWDGPDARVTSRDEGHCGPEREVTETHGIPAIISVADETGFWFRRFVPLDDGWGWTGYHHDGWQIWQGDEPRRVYLVQPGRQSAAFEYESFFCF